MLLRLSRCFASFKAGLASEVPLNSFKSVEFNGKTILLTKTGEKVHAISSKCTHWGVPLSAGYVDSNTAYCPAHCAGFDLKTGHSTCSPGLDSLPIYSTSIDSNGEVIVEVPDVPNFDEPIRRQVLGRKEDDRVFVIIGGGAAGNSCAETLRNEGFQGRVLIVSQETDLPVDRPNLSKNFSQPDGQFLIRDQRFYDEYDIEIKNNSTVSDIKTEDKEIVLQSGERIKYDKLCIASGSTARIFPMYKEAADNCSNVFSIRTQQDNQAISRLLQVVQNVVIIGGSFLGAEAACGIKKQYPNKQVTVIDVEQVPLSRALGVQIAQNLIDKQKDNGVIFLTGTQVKGINVTNDKATSVQLENSQIPADLILLATGAQIQTSFIPKSLLNDDGSVKVSVQMRTDNSDIFAVGDIASYFSVYTETRQRVEHWSVARDQASTAAQNMLGRGKSYTHVPFFWTNQFANAQFVGHGVGSDSQTTETGEGYIFNYFFKGENCIGVSIFGKFGAVPVFRAAFNKGLMPSKTEISKLNYDGILARVNASNS